MFAPTQASSVPASRLKTQTPHDVPLSEQALRLLGEQTTKNLYVFPGRPRAPLSTSSMSMLLRRTGIDAAFTD